MHHVDFAREEVDLAVRHGDGNCAGLDVVRLCTERLFPVCSPKLVSGHNRITKAADLLKFPLLHLDDWKTWSRWFDAAGVTWKLLRSGSFPLDGARPDARRVSLCEWPQSCGCGASGRFSPRVHALPISMWPQIIDAFAGHAV